MTRSNTLCLMFLNSFVEWYCCMYWKASDAAAVKRTIKGAMNRRKSTALNITNTMDAIKERQV